MMMMIHNDNSRHLLNRTHQAKAVCIHTPSSTLRQLSPTETLQEAEALSSPVVAQLVQGSGT